MPPYDYWADVTLTLPFHILVDERQFLVIHKGYGAIVKLVDKRPSGFENRLGIGQAVKIELKHDRRGLFRYSEAEVHVPGPMLPIKPEAIRPGVSNNDDEKRVVEVALAILNRFIDAYRSLSGEFHIGRLGLSDIVGNWAANIDWYRNGVYVYSSTVSLWGAGLTLERLPATAEFLDEMQHWLKQDKPVPLPATLILNARNYLDVGDFRMAVVDSRTALEVFLDETLWNGLQGVSLSEICKKLKLSSFASAKVRTLDDVLEKTSINDKLKYGLKECIQKSLTEDKSLWKRWLEVKKLREDVVHHGKEAAKAETEKHVNVVEEIAKFVGITRGSTNWVVRYVEKGSIETTAFGG